MNEVLYQTRLLNQAIKDSDDYTHYRQLTYDLKHDEKLYNRVKEFQKKNFNLQCIADYNTIDDVKRLRDEYSDILELTIVKEYLGAEQRLLSMLRQVEDDILSDIMIDTSAMDD